MELTVNSQSVYNCNRSLFDYRIRQIYYHALYLKLFTKTFHTGNLWHYQYICSIIVVIEYYCCYEILLKFMHNKLFSKNNVKKMFISNSMAKAI